jgi:serine phosphatase RsbU (regulator of sigma subunit)
MKALDPKFARYFSFIYFLTFLLLAFSLSYFLHLDKRVSYTSQILIVTIIAFVSGSLYLSLRRIVLFSIFKFSTQRDFNYLEMGIEVPKLLSNVVQVEELEGCLYDHLAPYFLVSKIALLVDKKMLGTKDHKLFAPSANLSIIKDMYESVSDRQDGIIFFHNGLFPELLQENFELAVILRSKQEKIGLLLLGKKASKAEFKELEVNTINSIAIQIASTIDRVSVYEKIKLDHIIQKEKIDYEYKIARDIQEKLLPAELPKIKKVDFDVLFEPAREASGDYYDFFMFSENKVAIVLIDIVGKGIPAAFTMINLKGIIHKNINPNCSANEFMAHLNSLLYADKSIQTFVPTFFGIVDLDDYKMTYVNTIGNAGALILKSNGEYQLLDKGGFMLGASEESDYEEGVVTLESGDRILCYTDGVLDQKNQDKEEFGINRVINALLQKSSFESDMQALYASYKEHKGSAIQSDDITVISLQIK